MPLYLFVRGKSWSVERRSEMTASLQRGRAADPTLFLFFTAADGEIRRSEIARDFPREPTARLLESVWRYAEVIRAGDPGEMTSRGEIVMPRVRDVLRDFWRAVLLRCPNCGGGHVLKSWFKLNARCPRCGIRLERGESDDYFLGGMFFNIVLAEVVFALVLLVVLLVMWPNIPWAGVQDSLIAAMIAAPILLYPVSRLMWLALDILLRPPDAAEMAWHSTDGE
jgi:uncharacterized protein (DUF983 family)